MPKQQSRRRRKRYQPGSAYAGDVKPTGIFTLFGDVRFIRAVFIVMAMALVGGGAYAAIFGTGVVGGHGGGSNRQGFVLPDDNDTFGVTTDGQDSTTEVTRYTGPPDMIIDPAKSYVATLTTELGDIQVKLFADQAPQTVNNFVFLAGEDFYDGLIFHYVQEDFSANAGDPACTAATLSCDGTGGPGYDLTEESQGVFERGTLGMVNGSQFFIALSGTESSLEQYQQFTAFGRVISGLDVAEQLAEGIEIQSIEIQES